MGFLEGNLSLLSQQEMDRIHESALQLLNQTGVRVEHESMLKQLEGVGAYVDHARMVATIPAAVMEKHIEQAARTVQAKAAASRGDEDDSRRFSLYICGTCPYVCLWLTALR